MGGVKSTNFLRWAIGGLMLVGLAMLPVGNSAFADGGHEHHSSRYGNHTLHGRYVASYHGFDSSNSDAPYAVSGVLISDGAGNVKGVQNIDYGAAGTGASFQCTFTGTYSVSNTQVNGSVTLNIAQNSCKEVTCSDSSNAPSCAPSSAASTTASQWFCSLSASSGKSMACTEMGEVPDGATSANEAPISAVTWRRMD